MKKGFCMTKQKGMISDLMTTGLCVIAMAFIVLTFFNLTGQILQKQEMGQLARKYILRMETVGFLTKEDEAALESELRELEVTEVNLSESTSSAAAYGNPIVLKIRGRLKGGTYVEEKRVSTSKN